MKGGVRYVPARFALPSKALLVDPGSGQKYHKKRDVLFESPPVRLNSLMDLLRHILLNIQCIKVFGYQNRSHFYVKIVSTSFRSLVCFMRHSKKKFDVCQHFFVEDIWNECGKSELSLCHGFIFEHLKTTNLGRWIYFRT